MSKPIEFGPLTFIHDKYSGLDGKTKVSFQGLAGAFKMVADQEGVKLEGILILSGSDELQGFAEALSRAWQEHRALVPKIITTPSGH